MKLWELLLLRHILKESNEQQEERSDFSMFYIIVNLIQIYLMLLVFVLVIMYLLSGQFSSTGFKIYNIVYLIFSLFIIIIKIASWFIKS
ncbi:MAG: hypothetical protein GX778_03675 [Erysipelothrix sp.]|nr:hypothetical protein [Erysipelothrix sp.]